MTAVVVGPGASRVLRGRSDIRCDECDCEDGVVLTSPNTFGVHPKPHHSVVYCERHQTISGLPK